MAIRVYKPTSPARRFMSVLTYEEITSTKPEKSLLEYKKKNAGRNAQGKITVRHQGGGNKVKYRIIDFKRDKVDIPAKVASIQYDPNRSAFIALLHYADGEKRYILAPLDLKVGDTVISSETADIKPGNTLPIKAIPVGTLFHNVEIKPGRGGQMVRSPTGRADRSASRMFRVGITAWWSVTFLSLMTAAASQEMAMPLRNSMALATRFTNTGRPSAMSEVR